MRYYIYILTNRNNTVLYTGVTNEETGDVKSAIEREKQIKSWSRGKKIALVYESNPKFFDLYPRLLG